MTDYIVKAIAFDGMVRVYGIQATETVNEAHERHDTWSASTAALGRTIVGTLLMSQAGLTKKDLMTVQISGNGPVGKIVATANGKGDIKAYIDEPHVALDLNDQGKIDVRGAVGDEGIFQVIKDLDLRQPFSGQTPIVSGELGEDFTYYMTVSEQTPSAFGLSVLVNPDESVRSSGGFMVQILPGCSDEVISLIEENLANIPQVSDLMEHGATAEDLIERVVGEGNYKILERRPVRFYCDCSKERFGNGIIALGAQEIKVLIEEEPDGIETTCHFCGSHYHFSQEDLKELLSLVK